MFGTECTWSNSLVPKVDISEGRVDVWKTELNVLPSVMSSSMSLLARDEVWRAERYCFARDRRRFVVGRAFLKTVLSLYVRCRPENIRFDYNAYGKPELADRASGDGLDFNLSHSHELALCAVTRNRRIGVDLEYARLDVEWERMAQTVFSESEYQSICTMPEADARTAFFKQWTLKEAYSKALGKGFSLPWRDFDICVRSGEVPRLRTDAEGQSWALLCFEPAPTYVAAIAIEGSLPYVKWRVLGVGAA